MSKAITIIERKDFKSVAVFKFTAGGETIYECKAWLDRADHWGLQVGSSGTPEFEDRPGRDGTPEKFIKAWNGDGGPRKGGGRSAVNPAREAAISKASDNKNASILACCAMNNATALLVARATQDPDFANALSPTQLKAWTLDAMAVLNQVTPGNGPDPFGQD